MNESYKKLGKTTTVSFNSLIKNHSPLKHTSGKKEFQILTPVFISESLETNIEEARYIEI